MSKPSEPGLRRRPSQRFLLLASDGVFGFMWAWPWFRDAASREQRELIAKLTRGECAARSSQEVVSMCRSSGLAASSHSRACVSLDVKGCPGELLCETSSNVLELGAISSVP